MRFVCRNCRRTQLRLRIVLLRTLLGLCEGHQPLSVRYGKCRCINYHAQRLQQVFLALRLHLGEACRILLHFALEDGHCAFNCVHRFHQLFFAGRKISTFFLSDGGGTFQICSADRDGRSQFFDLRTGCIDAAAQLTYFSFQFTFFCRRCFDCVGSSPGHVFAPRSISFVCFCLLLRLFCDLCCKIVHEAQNFSKRVGLRVSHVCCQVSNSGKHKQRS
mmetsp:Transcript_30227/g.96532  ORF Transcript_30227/g.96532 Transcript_30227/m.96532 type:complete len:218 (+) Transcript_30227:1524-2177(+)